MYTGGMIRYTGDMIEYTGGMIEYTGRMIIQPRICFHQSDNTT